jgi:putative SbcD/Mre11-related phosphoesterase
MDRSRYEVEKDMWLDARHALWLADVQALVVADLHLGYAWAHRAGGQLLPLSAPEDSLDRLRELQAEYEPSDLILLGDIVHRSLRLEVLKSELDRLVSELALRSALTLVTGNHDRNLDKLIERLPSNARLVPELVLGRYRFVHGHEEGSGEVEVFAGASRKPSRVVMGHEHPCISVGDGVATSARCPCFVIGPGLLILPAFSRWAAGAVIGRSPWMSSQARETQFKTAVAIMGRHLLPVPL